MHAGILATAITRPRNRLNEALACIQTAGRTVTLIHVFRYLRRQRHSRERTRLWFLVLPVLHHIVDVAQHGVDRVL